MKNHPCHVAPAFLQNAGATGSSRAYERPTLLIATPSSVRRRWGFAQTLKPSSAGTVGLYDPSAGVGDRGTITNSAARSQEEHDGESPAHSA